MTFLAHLVPNALRKSWALAYFPAPLSTTTLAFFPIAEITRLTRFGVIGFPVKSPSTLNTLALFLLGLTSFFVFNTLFGLRHDFGQAVRAGGHPGGPGDRAASLAR